MDSKQSCERVIFDQLIKKPVISLLLKFSLFPNPASQWITVEYDLQVIGNTNAVLNIIDATGRVVKSLELSGNKSSVVVDLTTLQKGIYLCNLVADKHTTTSRKLTIQ
jgi:hypothetical protein